MLNRYIVFLLLTLSPFLSYGEQTLSIIKPDAVKDRHIGEIISVFEKNGLAIAGIKMVQLSKKDAMMFYDIHQDKPFYRDLVNFMNKGPVVVMVLEGENAISKNRQLMGATNPNNAHPGTIRHRFAKDIQSNAVHGSDSPESAKKEIAFFFKRNEIYQN